ncbi:MAG: SDR family NAD(P)-dependent oxidoreductase [Nannocystaceae bacterium]|nr:SDR family NAD(P)-dependent oxidoreductase [Nannocystaceae bacterium]
MPEHTNRTAVVTGATSGLGLEAAAQLADAGYASVIITARTEGKAEAALAKLRAGRTADVFQALTVDLDDLASVASAADVLAARDGQIDVLLLNAGIAPTNRVRKTADGIEATTAATLTGHHVLTMRLLEAGLLSDRARIIIAGSEAARGDFPMFKPIDIDNLAAEDFDGDLETAIEALMRMQAPIKYHPNNQYATVKMFAVWWAAELAKKLPRGMTVNVVSPGSTPATNGARNAPFLMRWVIVPIVKLIPGMSHTVSDGAGRYLQATKFGPERTGQFLASKPKKGTGPLHTIEMEHFDNPAAQQALWNVTTKITGGVGYPA